MCFCSLADAHLILQTDPNTQICLTCQDVLVEDPGAALDQGTTTFGGSACYPAKFWSLTYGSFSAGAPFCMCVSGAQVREEERTQTFHRMILQSHLASLTLPLPVLPE